MNELIEALDLRLILECMVVHSMMMMTKMKKMKMWMKQMIKMKQMNHQIGEHWLSPLIVVEPLNDQVVPSLNLSLLMHCWCLLCLLMESLP